jgi:hypothetical protein
MAKIILYKIQSGEELVDASIVCKTQADFDVNYPIAEKEAVTGTITVEGEFEIEQPSQLDRIEAQLAYNSIMLGTLIEEV